MKKLFTSILAASLMLLGTQAYAQLVVGAGYLHDIENNKSTEGKAVGDPVHLNGFYVGASYNIQFAKYFGVAPGFYVDMLFQSKNNANGGTFGGVLLSGSVSYNYTEVALNLPVNLTFKMPIGDNADIFAFAGPTFQYGVMARSTFHSAATILTERFTTTMATRVTASRSISFWAVASVSKSVTSSSLWATTIPS